MLDSRPTRFGGAVTKSRRHAEYISDNMDDDLGICSENLDDNMDAGVISLYGLTIDAPGRRTPDFNTRCCVITTDI